MASRPCSFESFFLGLTNVPVVILYCSREVQNPRRFIFRAGGWQMCTFKHEAWLTEPAYDTWSVPSGDDSQWKHSICEGNHIQGALIKISGRALENEMIIYSLSQECSVSAVSRKFSGVEKHSRRCWERLVCPIMASLSHATWEFTL